MIKIFRTGHSIDQNVRTPRVFRFPVFRREVHNSGLKLKISGFDEVATKTEEPVAINYDSKNLSHDNIIQAEIDRVLDKMLANDTYFALEAFWAKENARYHDNDSLKASEYRTEVVFDSHAKAIGNRLAIERGLASKELYAPVANALDKSLAKSLYQTMVRSHLIL